MVASIQITEAFRRHNLQFTLDKKANLNKCSKHAILHVPAILFTNRRQMANVTCSPRASQHPCKVHSPHLYLSTVSGGTACSRRKHQSHLLIAFITIVSGGTACSRRKHQSHLLITFITTVSKLQTVHWVVSPSL